MGCAFDMYSKSWIDRSYVLTLFIQCWFVPLFVIFVAYAGIIYRVRHSVVREILSDKASCGLLKKEKQSETQRGLQRHRTSNTSLGHLHRVS